MNKDNTKVNSVLTIIFIILLVIFIILFTICNVIISYSSNLNSIKKQVNTYEKKNENILYDKTYNDILNVKVNSNTSEVEIKNTNEENMRIAIYGKKTEIEEKNITIEKNNIVINLKNKKIKKILTKKNTMSKIVIFIPKNYNDTINIKNNVGDIKTGNYNGNLIIKNDIGNINIKELNGSLNINNKIGDININKIRINKDSKVIGISSNITILDSNEVNSDASAGLGILMFENKSPDKKEVLTVKSLIGNVKVNAKNAKGLLKEMRENFKGIMNEDNETLEE